MNRARTLVVALALLLFMPVLFSPAAQAKDLTVGIEMRNVEFHPDFIRVDPGDVMTVFVTNNDSFDQTSFDHTFELDAFGISSGVISSGATWNATFTANRNGTFYFYCAIPGHASALGGGRWSGMAGRLQVGETTSSGPDATPIIVSGIVVLVVALVIIAYVVRRRKGPKPG